MASVLVSEADPDVRRLLVLVIERLGHEAIVLDGTVEVPSRASLLLLEPTSAASLPRGLQHPPLDGQSLCEALFR